ncbi:MAG: hypothetical protein NXI25_25305 [bacterium]|nr:hypothetical protein [bacterium]
MTEDYGTAGRCRKTTDGKLTEDCGNYGKMTEDYRKMTEDYVKMTGS